MQKINSMNEHFGFLFIDKPVDWTSHDVVGYLRRVTGIKKIGHAGTLDPFATGLLIVGVGRDATKRLDEFKGMKKEYVATVQLGATSDTQDLTGTITKREIHPPRHISTQEVKNILQSFVGTQQQIPPMYSAKKVQGEKLYELARKGKEIERRPIDIEIYKIALQDVTRDGIEGSRWAHIRQLFHTSKDTPMTSVTIRVSCATGTYIRTLCHDIGQALGTGAYCRALRRTKIGTYTVTQAITPELLTAETWHTYVQHT